MNDKAKLFRAMPGVLAWCALHALGWVSLCRADSFGDVVVSADAIYTGSTFHGYAEIRVALENLRLTGRTR
jgi:hypothetical protein